MKFESTKWRVRNKQHSAQIQEYLFSLGYKWSNGGSSLKHLDKPYLYTNRDGAIAQGSLHSTFSDDYGRECVLETEKNSLMVEFTEVEALAIASILMVVGGCSARSHATKLLDTLSNAFKSVKYVREASGYYVTASILKGGVQFQDNSQKELDRLIATNQHYEYPMFFKENGTPLVIKFTGLTEGEVLVSHGSMQVGEVYRHLTKHTDSKWELIENPIVEMTMEEICEALGKTIKIIKG